MKTACTAWGSLLREPAPLQPTYRAWLAADDIEAAHEALAFLDGLSGQQRANAERYVRRTPPEIRPLYRRRFEQQLGWTPEPPTT